MDGLFRTWNWPTGHEPNDVKLVQNTSLSGMPNRVHINGHNRRRNGLTTAKAQVTPTTPLVNNYAMNVRYDL